MRFAGKSSNQYEGPVDLMKCEHCDFTRFPFIAWFTQQKDQAAIIGVVTFMMLAYHYWFQYIAPNRL